MLTLYKLPRLGLPLLNLSPFCMKVELYLRMASIVYHSNEVVSTRNSPKKKLPWVEFDGLTLSDSQQIVEVLQRRYNHPVPDLRDHPDPVSAHAMRKLIEESLYWVIVYSRWQFEIGFRQTRAMFYPNRSPATRYALAGASRQLLRLELWGQGYGRHSADEVFAIGREDLIALDEFLSRTCWANGDHAGVMDAICYAFIANILVPPVETPLKDFLQSRPNLLSYHERAKTALEAPVAGPAGQSG